MIMTEYTLLEFIYLMKRRERFITNNSFIVYEYMLKLRKEKMNEKEKVEYEKAKQKLNELLERSYDSL